MSLNSSDKEEEEDKLTPKRLFSSEVYDTAQKALTLSVPETFTEREKELKELEIFLEHHLENKTSGSLFIAGLPGTGKTACLSKTMQKEKFESAFKIIYVNCTGMKLAATVYVKILEKLHIHPTKSEASNKARIEKYLSSNHKMLLLVLDEIDQLDCKNQSILYSLFEWPSRPRSKLVLIGIANDLNLTHRLLPRLQYKQQLVPKKMYFSPYTKQQIINIITTRLNEAHVSDIFVPTAITLLAGKIAAISGDIRQALDISRRIIGIVKSNKISQVLQPTSDTGSNTESPKKQSSLVSDKLIQTKEVMAILNAVYGGSSNVNNQEITFPLQQKLLICALLLILNKGRNKDVTISMLHEVYQNICKKCKIQSLDFAEFLNICSLIAERGILKINGRKMPRLSKIELIWDKEQLDVALRDEIMLAKVINDVSCLGRQYS